MKYRGRRLRWFEAYWLISMGVVMLVGNVGATYYQFWHLTYKLRAADYVLVEGTVTGFLPLGSAGQTVESFVVNGHRYEYSGYVWSAGFSNSQSHGGPMRDGMCVRIADVDGRIARLEIAVDP